MPTFFFTLHKPCIIRKIQHDISLILKRKIKYHSFTQIGISFCKNHCEQVSELNSVCNERLSSEEFYSVVPFIC